jgi:hypothetical protein
LQDEGLQLDWHVVLHGGEQLLGPQDGWQHGVEQQLVLQDGWQQGVEQQLVLQVGWQQGVEQVGAQVL